MSATPFSELAAQHDQWLAERKAAFLRSTPDLNEPHVCGPDIEDTCHTCKQIDELEAEAMFSEPVETESLCCFESPNSPRACDVAIRRDEEGE